MVLDITLFKAGSQKCIDYKWAFFYKFYTFLFGYNITGFVLCTPTRVIKKLWCTNIILMSIYTKGNNPILTSNLSYLISSVESSSNKSVSSPVWSIVDRKS